MEKLSSILPSNPRVKSVDMADAQPRRPGAPAFGAPVGRNTVQDRVTLSQAAAVAAAPAMIKDSPTYNPRDFRTSKTADYKTNDFFNNRLKPTESDLAASEVALEGLDEHFAQAPTPAKISAQATPEPEFSGSLQETFQ